MAPARRARRLVRGPHYLELHGVAPHAELVLTMRSERWPSVVLGYVSPIWDRPAVVINPRNGADWEAVSVWTELMQADGPWSEPAPVRWRPRPPRQPRRTFDGEERPAPPAG